MRDLGNCDFCGAPVGFYGCPKHGTDCYDPDQHADDPTEQVAEQWRCTCTGQGGSVYSSECPVHDHTVDTDNPVWRAQYDAHLEGQRRIKERLGW